MSRPTRQLRKLKKILNKNDFIYHEEQAQIGMFRIDLIKVYFIDNDRQISNTFSIANGFGTEGGYDLDTNFKNQGLLEVYKLDTRYVKGYLTAKDVLEYLKKERGETNA